MDLSSDSKSASMQAVSATALAEMKKVFAIFDTDSSGTIAPAELAGLLQKLSGATPTKQEVEAMLRKIDSNQDGVISWEEFVGALQAWIAEEDSSIQPVTGRKRKQHPTSPQQNRSKVHRRIQSFFLQFQKKQNFSVIRQKYFANNSSSQKTAYLSSNEGDKLLHSSVGSVSADEKKVQLQAIEATERYLGSLPQISNAVLQMTNPALALQGVEAVANMLSICDVFPTPESRYAMGDLFLKIFARVGETGMMKRIVNFLSPDCVSGYNEGSYQLQYQACRVVTYFAPGPRVAHTPLDSILHPSKRMHKNFLITAGAAHFLRKLLESRCREVRDQAIVAIGMLARDDFEVRDLLLQLGCFHVMVNLINDAAPLELLLHITWTVAIFSGASHGTEHPPDYKLVGTCLPKLAYLLFNNNDSLLTTNILTALKYLLPGIAVDPSIMRRVIEVAGYPDENCQRVALQILVDLVTIHTESVTAMIPLNLLGILSHNLTRSRDTPVLLLCLELVVLMAQRGHMHQIMQSSEAGKAIVPAVIQLLRAHEETRHKSAACLHTLTTSVSLHIPSLMAKDDLVRVLSSSLVHFKDYDKVLRDQYKYLGASYNFHYAQDLINALGNIRNAVRPSELSLPYFDLGCVHHINGVLTILSTELTMEMDSWRDIDDKSHAKLEDSTVALMQTLMQAHGENAKATNNAESIAIHKTISENLTKFKQVLAVNRRKVETKRKQKKRVQSNQYNQLSSPYDPYPMNNNSSTSASSSNGITSGNPYASNNSNLNNGNNGLNVDYNGQNITFKCFFNGDNRVLSLPGHSVNIKSLKMQLQYKYGDVFEIQYEDHEGDKITIDTPQVLQAAMAKWSQDGSFKVYLKKTSYGGQKKGGNNHNNNDWNTWGGQAHNGKRNKFHNKNVNWQTNGDVFNSMFDHNKAGKKNRQKAIAQLAKKTKFSKQQLDNLYRQFNQHQQNGTLDKNGFEISFNQIGQNDQTWIDQTFSAFDHDKDGYINFADFVHGLSILKGGNMNERLHLVFSAYDLDNNGYIDKAELFEIIKSGFISKDMAYNDAAVQEVVENVFASGDQNNDGRLDFNEFKSSIMQQRLAVESFWSDAL